MPEYTELEIQQIKQAQVHSHLRMQARLAEQRQQQAQAMPQEQAASPFSLQSQPAPQPLPQPQVLANPFSIGGASSAALPAHHKHTEGSLLPVFLVLALLAAVIWKLLKSSWD